ncbi:methyl-accepting chemotaxis protein, partial [Alkalispirillum mobile]|uniref:methyl-accepting chemotaxis protein n=1 Tax=Alkalispirillum mobile TaxID=85925 RepID=UPI001474EB42
MLKNMKIGTRLAFAVSILAVVGILLLSSVFVWRTFGLIDTAEERELDNVHRALQAQIEADAHMAEGFSALIANLPPAQEHFADRDREALADLLQGTYDTIADPYGLYQFQFHEPPATSFYRFHRPDRYGDDLSDVRHTIVATNEDETPVRGLEGGPLGIGIRGVSPVHSPEGAHSGAVEFGMDLGQVFVERFAEEFGVEVTLFALDDNRFTSLASTIGGESLIGQDALHTAWDGDMPRDTVERNGTPMATQARMIRDFSGEPIAVVEIGMDRSFYAASMRNTVVQSAGVAVLGILIGVGVALWLAHGIVRPIRATVQHMNEIAQGDGDLTRHLDDSGRDEMSDLATAFNQFVDKIRKLVRETAEATSQIAAASEQMATIARQTSDGTRRQQDDTTQVATAMNEMTSTVAEIARTTQEAADLAHGTASKAEDGRQVVHGS